MSEPKRGTHCEHCIITRPNCPCNTCQKDDCRVLPKFNDGCCDGNCNKTECKRYIKDEPTKKGAEK